MSFFVSQARVGVWKDYCQMVPWLFCFLCFTSSVSSYTEDESNYLLFFFLPSGVCIDLDLGMENGVIPNSKITTSSKLNAGTPANNSRLNYTAGPSWCAQTNDSNPYLQIDLQSLHVICAVSTQGNSKADEWVETYKIQTSKDGVHWTDYDNDGHPKVSDNGGQEMLTCCVCVCA